MKNRNYIDVLTNRSIGNSLSSHLGIGTTGSIKNKAKGPTKLEKNIAEKLLLRKVYTGSRSIRECHLPSFRANFLIVFSPDGSKLATTNGNHNVYIIDVATNKILRILEGHRRTPWTVAFHPNNNHILASGCLSGEVRVWNLNDGTFETWQSPGQTVVSSLAFHPKFSVLAIATYKDIYFLDWNTSMAFGQTSTEGVEEKIRYVKFDSTGDKLITAIALENKMLCQYDSIAFREVFQFSCERRLLKDIKMIEKFCESHIHQVEQSKFHSKPENESKSTSEVFSSMNKRNILNRLYGGFTLVGETMPYMCTHHYNVINSSLNVGCFCPTRFSKKIMETLKKNQLPFDHLVSRCYFCRYTWLYQAVFQLRIMNQQKNHICKEVQRRSNDYHIWLFSDRRTEELIEENANQINGVTEETLRYCFEQFATVRIAPHFAELIPVNGICTRNIKFNPLNFEYGDEGRYTNSKKLFTHEIPMRSDCFLNFCETFNFKPFGTFLPFLTSFAELYHYLPALQQISTKEDRLRLTMIMTEWEYLYCKLLLINNMVEGDGGMILKKRSFKSTPSDENINVGASTSFTLPEDVNNKTPVRDEKSKEFGNCEHQQQQCDLCDKFEGKNEKLSSSAMQFLRKDIEILSNEIVRRNDTKVQRNRMEKLYKQQLETEISRIDGALFITIQIIKKCIRTHLSTSVLELKKLLKHNLSSVDIKDDRFCDVYTRLFIFITKRVVTFSRSILEFLCDYKYNIKELTKIGTDSVKTVSSLPHASSTLRSRQRSLNFGRNYNFDDDPVFKEEHVSFPSDLADDESNVQVSENILSGVSDRCRPGPSNQSTDYKLFQGSPNQIFRKVVASRSYIDKHLRFLEHATDGRARDDSDSMNSSEIMLLQNVNLLLYQLRFQIEHNPELYSNHPLHRLQVWDFSKLHIPDISNRNHNMVVSECKVHNDATISISHDNMRVAVLLSPNQYDQPDWLGVFSLEWKTMGQILCAVALNQIAVSLSFSPTDQYLAVGFSFMYYDDLKMADIISVQQEIDKWRDFSLLSRKSPIATSLIDISFVHRTEFIITVNCIRWSPVAGQGLIFGNSFGEIKFVV